MRVTIIIATYSFARFQHTIDAVNSLLNQTFDDKEIIVVVDGNKKLFSKLRASLPSNVHVALCPNAGASSARNMGVKLATGDIVVFIDDDITLDRNCLSVHVRNYDNPRVIGVGGCIKPLWTQKTGLGCFPEELYWMIGCTYKGFSETSSEVRNNFGGNFSFKREVFNKLSFPTTFQKRKGTLQGTEDTQFAIGVLQMFNDLKIVYDPEAVAYHRVYPYRLSLRYILRRAYSEGISKGYIAKMYKLKGKRVLSVESAYLFDMITKFLPKRLLKILKRENIVSNVKNILLFLIVIGTVLFGYIVENLLLRFRKF